MMIIAGMYKAYDERFVGKLALFLRTNVTNSASYDTGTYRRLSKCIHQAICCPWGEITGTQSLPPTVVLAHQLNGSAQLAAR